MASQVGPQCHPLILSQYYICIVSIYIQAIYLYIVHIICTQYVVHSILVQGTCTMYKVQGMYVCCYTHAHIVLCTRTMYYPLTVETGAEPPFSSKMSQNDQNTYIPIHFHTIYMVFGLNCTTVKYSHKSYIINNISNKIIII